MGNKKTKHQWFNVISASKTNEIINWQLFIADNKFFSVNIALEIFFSSMDKFNNDIETKSAKLLIVNYEVVNIFSWNLIHEKIQSW